MYDIQGTVTISIEDFNKIRDAVIEVERERNHAEFELEQLKLQNEFLIRDKFDMQVEIVKEKIYPSYWEKENYEEDYEMPLYSRTNLGSSDAIVMSLLIRTKAEWEAIVDELDRQVQEAAAKAELDRLAEEALAGTPEEQVEATEK